LVRQPVYYVIPAGETTDIIIPKGTLDITRPLNFKLASQRGTISSSLAIVYSSIIPPAPSLFTFYPTASTITVGSYVGGSLPSSVQYVDGSYFTIASSPSIANPLYYPSSYVVQSGSHVNGSVSLLQSQDQQSMYFLSSPSSQVNRTYNASSYTILNGSLAGGSLPDTYAQDDYRMTFSSQTVSQSSYPVANMNFTYNASGWSAYLSEAYPTTAPSNVTTRSSGFVSANQRAVARTGDPDRTVHVVYSNGTYLGYSLSADGGNTFVDQLLIGGGYEPGYNPTISSDINNNVHIAYQNAATSPQQIRYILLSYNSSYGGNPLASSNYQTITASVSWSAHFIAMNGTLSTIQLYIMNVSTPNPLIVEVRKTSTDGTPDLSQSGLVASTSLTNIPTTLSWVNATLNATLEKGKQYAVLLRSNGTYRWAYTSLSYAGSMGGWSYASGSWTVSPTTHFSFSIPGWFGWVSSTPITVYSVTGTTTVQRPVIALYPYLTSQDQGYYSAPSSISIYGGNYYAQSFTPSSSVLSGVMLYLYRTGSPPDDLHVEVRRSNGSYPDMSPSGILTSGRIDSGRVIDAGSAQWFDCIFSYPAALSPSQIYWIVLYSPSSTSSNCWIWYYNAAGGYPNGNAASSADGGGTWTTRAWDFSFRTYSYKDERPALAWYYQAQTGTNRLQIQFLRCLPNYDPKLASSWYNYAGTGQTPDRIYGASTTTETRLTMTVQPNTNNLYFFFIRANTLNVYYNRIYRWNPDTGNWGTMGSATQVISGVYLSELSSAPEPYRDWVVFAAVSSSTGNTYVQYFDSRNVQVDISPSASMRYPSITCIAGRIYVVYQSASGIYYRYYNGSWSGPYQYYSSSSSSLPNTIYRPSASSVDFVWLEGTSRLIYGSVYPIGLLEVSSGYSPANGNPGGSGGGSFYYNSDDGYFDYSFYGLNVTFYTDFTPPPSWDSSVASFAWQFNLTSCYGLNYGGYSHVKLNSVRLILSDTSGNDLQVLYTDDNNGNGWTGSSAGYFYRTGIPVTYSLQNTDYRIKVVFEIGCSDPSDMPHITARVDDVGLIFTTSSSLLNVEFSGTSDTDEWSSILINIVHNITEIPANFTLRVYNFAIGRYPVYGEEGYFSYSINTLSEEYRSFQISSNSNDFRNSTGGWRLSITVSSDSDFFLYGLNMLNFAPQVSVHSVQVEFTGSSDLSEWASLLWNSTQAFSTSSVSVTVQLYNYTASAYQTSGFGYLTYTSGPPFAYQSFSQETSTNPGDFRDGSGNWKLRITATKVGQQFYMLNDYLLYSPTRVSQQQVDAYFTFTGIAAGTIVNMTYNVTSLFSAGSVSVTFQIWDYSTSSWSTLYSVSYTSSPVPNTPQTITITITSDFSKYISAGESRIRVYAVKGQQPNFNFSADQIKLDMWAV